MFSIYFFLLKLVGNIKVIVRCRIFDQIMPE